MSNISHSSYTNQAGRLVAEEHDASLPFSEDQLVAIHINLCQESRRALSIIVDYLAFSPKLLWLFGAPATGTALADYL